MNTRMRGHAGPLAFGLVWLTAAACDPRPVEPADAPLLAVIPDRPTCSGSPATLWPGMPPELVPAGARIGPPGQAGGFTVHGTAGRDVIVGSDGPDHLYGGAGNDVICAGPGDQAWGGQGNDHVFGFGPTGKLRGGPGNDRLVGDAGPQWMTGGAGNDVLVGAAGDDILLGGPDHDVLTGGPDGDFFGGCDGTDVATDFDSSIPGEVQNGTVEHGIPADAPFQETPHGDGGDGDCGGGGDCGGDHDDGGCDEDDG